MELKVGDGVIVEGYGKGHILGISEEGGLYVGTRWGVHRHSQRTYVRPADLVKVVSDPSLPYFYGLFYSDGF